MQHGAGHIQNGADGDVTLWLAARADVAGDAGRLGSMLARLGVLEPPTTGAVADWPLTISAITGITGKPMPLRLVGGAAARTALTACGEHHDAPHIIGLSLGQITPADRTRAVQTMARLASLIGAAVDAEAIYWPPAKLWSDAVELPHAVAAMEGGGMPPILHFIRFWSPRPGEMITDGLGWLAGHELAATMPSDMTLAEGVRRLARVAIDLMLNGSMAGDMVIAGLAGGERIQIHLPQVAGEPIRLAITTGGRA